MLAQYSSAIMNLRQHFLTKDTASLRITLVACIVFTCLEFLRGKFHTAQTHLKNGLQILVEAHGSVRTDNGILILQPSRNTIDQRIMEAFVRLQLQVEFFRQTYRHPVVILQLPTPGTPIARFNTINEAWGELERLFNSIFHLSSRAQVLASASASRPSLETHLRAIQALLTHWTRAYMLSKPHLATLEPTGFFHHILSIYHAVAAIMASTVLGPESAFDEHTAKFLSIVVHSTTMWRARRMKQGWIRASLVDMSHSMIDMGWIPPLYYTALKCRVRKIRQYAVRLLECSWHREGIWDGRIAAAVAKRMVEIEEEGLEPREPIGEDDWIRGLDEVDDMSLPSTPPENRLRELKVALEDDAETSVLVEYRRANKSAGWERVRIDTKGSA